MFISNRTSECVISPHQCKLLLSNREHELLAPLINKLLGLDIVGSIGLAYFEVARKALHDGLTIQSKVEVAEDIVGFGFVSFIFSSA